MKKILFVGAEAMPFAATGGLGDVLGSLPSAINETAKGKADVRVIMPLYSEIGDKWRTAMETVAEFDVWLSWRRLYCGVKKLNINGITYYFVDNQYYFYRETMYGCYDDGERFAFFCRAVLEFLSAIDYYPDILHANDWHSALCPVYLKTLYSENEKYKNIKSVFTIHNIEYQGKYDMSIIGDVFGIDDKDKYILEYDGAANLMKAAIVTADAVTTVSPNYANEILDYEHSHGLHHVLKMYSDKLSGILNGIDYSYYDPYGSDIEERYTWRSLGRKAVNKKALQQELGLPIREEVPLLAVISRLASHKGIDLIKEKMYNVLEENDVQFIILGKGDIEYEDYFCRLQNSFQDKVRALITYDRALSKRIYAAADILIMPSRSEPCGLSQMIASRYGAIPVVRETGGLYDSIKPYREEGKTILGNGFTFCEYDADKMKDSILDAISVWSNRDKRTRIVGKIMRTDFSWKGSAKRYLDMYDLI